MSRGKFFQTGKSADDIARELGNGLDIFLYYMAADGRYSGTEIRPFKKYKSPLRDEKHPSFEIYRRNTHGDFWFSDFNGTRSGSCWDFVMQYFGIDFSTAIKKVKQDLLGELGGVAAAAYVRQSYAAAHTAVRDKILYTPDYRYLEPYDMELWNPFLIYPDVMHLFHVHPVNSYLFQKGNKSFRIYNTPHDPVYFINFPNVNRNKIYRPKAQDKRFKWTSNTIGEEDIFGFDICPPKADKGFVVAGNKDTMSFFNFIKAYLRYPVIAFNSETFTPTSEMMFMLNSIAPNWYSIYDPDATGIKMSTKLEGDCGILSTNQVLTDIGLGDWSEMVKGLLQAGRFDELADIKKYYEQL